MVEQDGIVSSLNLLVSWYFTVVVLLTADEGANIMYNFHAALV